MTEKYPHINWGAGVDKKLKQLEESLDAFWDKLETHEKISQQHLENLANRVLKVEGKLEVTEVDDVPEWLNPMPELKKGDICEVETGLPFILGDSGTTHPYITEVWRRDDDWLLQSVANEGLRAYKKIWERR
jgi:hypothetical protein